MDKCEYCNADRPGVGVLRVCCEEGAAADYQPMTPDKVEAALGVLRELISRFDATIPTPMNHRGESTMRIEHFVDLSFESKQAIATVTAALAERERDAARLDYIERTFSGMTNRERYLPVQMIWGNGCNGRTLREACDKYMKRDAAMKETP